METWRGMIVTATVRLRRGPGWTVKPEAEALDGETYEFMNGWEIDATCSSIYIGETAWLPADLDSWPKGAPKWIASGDLEMAGRGETIPTAADLP